MHRQRFPQRFLAQLRLIAWQFRHIGWWRRNGFSKQSSNNPITSLDRASAEPRCIFCQEHGHRQQSTPSIGTCIVDANPFVHGNLFACWYAVVTSQVRIDKRVFRFHEIEHRRIVLNNIHAEPNRLLKHRLSQRVGKARKSISIHAVVLFESPEIQPVTSEVGRETSGTWILQHPTGFRDHGIVIVQFPCRSPFR